MRSLNIVSFLLVAVHGATVRQRDEAATCEYPGSIQTSQYNINNWMEENYLPENAQQCVTLDGSDGDSIRFHSNFTYSPAQKWIVGYPNVSPKGWEKRPIEDHESIPTEWEWSLDGTDVKASVNYYLGGAAGCLFSPSWQASIWLGTFGEDLVPNDSSGKTGTLIASTQIAGVDFDVYRIVDPIGFATIMWIFQAKKNQTSFSGDILEFLRWLQDNDKARIGCVWDVQAGAEVYGAEGGTFATIRYNGKQILKA